MTKWPIQKLTHRMTQNTYNTMTQHTVRKNKLYVCVFRHTFDVLIRLLLIHTFLDYTFTYVSTIKTAVNIATFNLHSSSAKHNKTAAAITRDLPSF